MVTHQNDDKDIQEGLNGQTSSDENVGASNFQVPAAPVLPDVAPSRHNDDEKSKDKEGKFSVSSPGAFEVRKKSEQTKLHLAPAVDERQENAKPRNSASNQRKLELAPAVHDETPRTINTKGDKNRTTPATNPGAVEEKNDSSETAESKRRKLALADAADPAGESRPGAHSETRDSSTSKKKGTTVHLAPGMNPGVYEVQGGAEVKKEVADKSNKLQLAPAVPPPMNERHTTTRDSSSRLRLAPAVDPGFSPPATPNQSDVVDPAQDPAHDSPSTVDPSTQPTSTNTSLDPSSSQGDGLLQAEVAPDVQQLVADAVRQAMTNTNPSSRQNLQREQSIALAEELSDGEQPEEIGDEEAQGKGDKDEDDNKICGLPKPFVLVALGAIIIAIIIAVVSISGGETVATTSAPTFASESPSLAPSSMPSLLPSSSPTSALFLSYGAALLPGIDVYSMDKESAEYRALEWIALEDNGSTLNLDPEELSERFQLAVFYLSTDGENSWIQNQNWMTSTSHCQWKFVVCMNGKVTMLLTESNNLVGSLPTELFGLTNLVQLMLNGNVGLGGTIPTEIGNLRAMSALTFSNNELIGTIPREIGQLSKLYLLSLRENELSGAIPSELALVTGLKVLDLSANPFLSPIPVELTQLSQLMLLGLGFGMLQGTIPTEFGLLTRLVTLFMYGNSLEGPIPSEIGTLSMLQALELNDNILSGSIPTEIGKLTALTSLRLPNNVFSGPIPSEIGNLPLLYWLDMHNTGLVGAIPSEIGRLTRLTQLGLAGNELRGIVPSELNQLTNVHTVDLYGNGLTGGLETTFCNQTMEFFTADCLETTPEVVCGCCTHCCHSSSDLTIDTWNSRLSCTLHL